MNKLKTFMIILVLFATSVAVAQQKEITKPEVPDKMKTYLIEREIPGAGTLTESDLQGASQKSCEVLKTMGTGIEWINSYVVDDKFFCVYKADNEKLLREHAEKGGFPINKIMEVKSNIGPSTAIATKK